MKVSVYVEGGGDQDRTLTECRKAFHSLLDPSWPEGKKAKIIASGGRHKAFKYFCDALRREEYAVLLVDSEGPVTAADHWRHLEAQDGWQRPEQARADQAQLMAQCMESWFFADIDALEKYFAQGFSRSALRSNPDIESVPKGDVITKLQNAVKGTSKKRYHKVNDGFPILGSLNFEKVCERSPHARAFRDTVKNCLQFQ